MAIDHANTAAHTGSLWTAFSDMPECAPLAEDLRVDVCIVGAGIAGLSIAYMLTRAGKSVAVLDDGMLASGESSMTTAHLTCVLDERYYNLEQIHGGEGARLAAESHMTAINRMETIIASEGIDCDFERLNGYLFHSDDRPEDELLRELDAAQRVGIDAALVDTAPKPSLDTGKCLLFPNQAQFHPLKYLGGLARAIQRDGGRLFTMSRAEHFEGGIPAQVTANGHVITADSVVVATHAPVNNVVAIHTKQTAWLSYVIGARIARGTVMRALYWDSGFPYHYARIQGGMLSNAGGDVLIVGGEDHRTGQADDTDERHGRLEAWARQRFPFLDGIAYTWSGQIMQSVDGLAFIGRNPMDDSNVYVVTGDSGTGMTYATIAAILITDLIEDRPNSWQSLYDPARKSLRAARAYVGEAARTAAQYADWVKPGDVKSIDEIERDSGAVVNEGLSPVAVYREPDGTTHKMSAICVHLGCIVTWNQAERTWDCPCHGSRYDRFGSVINGPANSNLPRRPAE
jgi:glycine/D-amino acid oxidase-like deaminating enzyme/nitrite reductase/ring-hydroxylating ferredoxin subunit